MPLYEFECTKCEHKFERLQRYSDPPPEACPVCGGAVSQLMSAPAIQFKGTGWYVTDYAKKNSGPASHPSGNGKNGGTSASAETPAATTSESKPVSSETKPASSAKT